jgi:hypothetical protein
MNMNSHPDRPDVNSSEIFDVERNVAGEWLSELNNCLANASLNFLKRLHDGTPVCQRYRDGEVVHSHHMAAESPICLRWRRRNFSPLECLLHPDEFAMPVGVGEFAEKLEWLPSVVRLKPLEKCEMFIGYTPEKSVAVLREAVWRAFKGKLEAVRNSALVLLLPKSAGQVVECIAQATRELADDNSDSCSENISRLRNDIKPLLIGGEIRIGVNNILPEPFQVFLCPSRLRSAPG